MYVLRTTTKPPPRIVAQSIISTHPVLEQAQESRLLDHAVLVVSKLTVARLLDHAVLVLVDTRALFVQRAASVLLLVDVLDRDDVERVHSYLFNKHGLQEQRKKRAQGEKRATEQHYVCRNSNYSVVIII